MEKCHFPPSVVIRPDGKNELDPCIYEENCFFDREER